MARCTRAEVELRITAVLELMRDQHASFDDVLQFASESDWRVSDRTLRNYMLEATKLIRRGMDQMGIVEEIYAEWRTIYLEAKEAGELRTAGLFLDRISKIAGLYPKGPPRELPAPTPVHRLTGPEREKLGEDFRDWEPPSTLQLQA